MGFWKEVSMEMEHGMSKREAIDATVKYYQKYKPNYFGHTNEKQEEENNSILQNTHKALVHEVQ